MSAIQVGTAMTTPLLQGGHAVAKPLLERAVAAYGPQSAPYLSST